GEFLDGTDVFDVTHSGAAVFRRENYAHKPELAQLFDRRQREFTRFVPLHDIGRDLALGELAHALFQLKLFFVELKIQGSSGNKGCMAAGNKSQISQAQNFRLEHSIQERKSYGWTRVDKLANRPTGSGAGLLCRFFLARVEDLARHPHRRHEYV